MAFPRACRPSEAGLASDLWKPLCDLAVGWIKSDVGWRMSLPKRVLVVVLYRLPKVALYFRHRWTILKYHNSFLEQFIIIQSIFTCSLVCSLSRFLIMARLASNFWWHLSSSFVGLPVDDGEGDPNWWSYQRLCTEYCILFITISICSMYEILKNTDNLPWI